MHFLAPKVLHMKNIGLLVISLQLVILISCAKKEGDDTPGKPFVFGDGKRDGKIYRGEQIADQASRFDAQVANNDTLFTEVVTPNISGSTSYSRTDVARMRKGQTARVILPNELECVPNAGSFTITGPLSADQNNERCQARVTLSSTAMTPANDGVYGTVTFTGTVRHARTQKPGTYILQIKDVENLNGRTAGADTPASQGDDEQAFISIGDQLDLGEAAGQIAVYQYQDNNGQPLNALLFPVNTLRALTSLTINLKTPPAGWAYAVEPPQTEKCWMIHTNTLNEALSNNVDDYNILPLNDVIPRPAGWDVGDPLCPINIVSLNQAAATANIELLTEPLPGLAGRHTIKGLGTYGSFREGPRNFVGYELRMKIVNAANSIRYIVNTVTFNINVRKLLAPSQLASHQILGSYEGHFYVLLNTQMTQAEAANQAALLKNFYGGSESYVVEVNDQAEQDFLKTKVPSGRTWIGLNDLQREGTMKWMNAGTSTYRNFASGEPNNDGNNEDTVHMNYNNDGEWNDTEAYKTFKAIVEMVLPTDDTADNR